MGKPMLYMQNRFKRILENKKCVYNETCCFLTVFNNGHIYDVPESFNDVGILI